MKGLLLILFLMAFCQSFGQGKPEAFSEARRALASLDSDQRRFDSLSSLYDGRWSIYWNISQRFLTADSKASIDTTTFSDFTGSHLYYELGGGFFPISNVQITANIGLAIMPRDQEIRNISFGPDGISAEGQGSGGAILVSSAGAKYLFKNNSRSTAYVSAKISRSSIIAKGGTSSISGGSRDDDFRRLSDRLYAGELGLGLITRMNPGLILDFNTHYFRSSKGQSIGGIDNYTGLSFGLGMHFIINKGKK